MKKIIYIVIVSLVLIIISSCENNVGLEDNVIKNPFLRDTLSIDTTLIDYKRVVITTVVVQRDTIRDTVLINDTPIEEVQKGKLKASSFEEIHDLKRSKDRVIWVPISTEKITAKLVYSMGITLLELNCDVTAKEIDFKVGFKRYEAVKNFKLKIRTNLYDLLNSPLYITDFTTNSNISGDVTILTKDGSLIKNPDGIEVGLSNTLIAFLGYKVSDLGLRFALILPSGDQQDPDFPFFAYQGELMFNFEN